jgi:hypothetical protein
VALSWLFAVDGAELGLQGRGGREAIGERVGVGQRVDVHLLDECDVDWSHAGDVAALSGPHVAEFPEANGLGFFAAADGVEELFLEEEYTGSVGSAVRNWSPT